MSELVVGFLNFLDALWDAIAMRFREEDQHQRFYVKADAEYVAEDEQ